VPALILLLKHEKREMRLAALIALGSIDSESAAAGVIGALADPEPSISQEAAAILVKKKRTPLQASLLVPRDPVAPGEALSAEWRVTNLSPADVELALEEAPAKRLKMTGPQGPVTLAYPESGARRVLRLGPGEYVGGSFPKLTLSMPVAGRYTLNWTATISWNGLPVALPAAPASIDRR
jgi:hypothetical protein